MTIAELAETSFSKRRRYAARLLLTCFGDLLSDIERCGRFSSQAMSTHRALIASVNTLHWTDIIDRDELRRLVDAAHAVTFGESYELQLALGGVE